MGCGASLLPEAPPLVAQPLPAAAPLIAKASSAEGELKLLLSEGKAEGSLMNGYIYRAFFNTAGGEEIIRYKQKGNAKMFTIYHGDNLVALLKHELYRGFGHAELYGLQPPEGASGHATIVEEGISLHALYQIRVTPEAGTGLRAHYKGIGMYAAGANGTFAAAPSLVHKDSKKEATKFVENGKGECVATTCFQPLRPVFGKLERGITAAANVDITLIAVLYIIRLEFWNNVDNI